MNNSMASNILEVLKRADEQAQSQVNVSQMQNAQNQNSDHSPTGLTVANSNDENNTPQVPNPNLPNGGYKRPPHTYPSLIAQAILDAEGYLITLRGIYDYIMDKYPYYKFGHDKSAWQNSIRHNLSLNQCFIKSKYFFLKC